MMISNLAMNTYEEYSRASTTTDGYLTINICLTRGKENISELDRSTMEDRFP